MDNMGFNSMGPVCFSDIIGKYLFNIFKYVIVVVNTLHSKGYSKYIAILMLFVDSN